MRNDWFNDEWARGPQRWRMNQPQPPDAPYPKLPPQHTQPIGQPQPVGQATGPFQSLGGFVPPFQGEQPQWGRNWNWPQQQGMWGVQQDTPHWLEMLGGWRR